MNENYNIHVDIDNLIEKKRIIDEKYNELVHLIKKYREMIVDTRDIFNTPAANLYQNISSQYIDLSLVRLDKRFKKSVDRLDNIIFEYKDFYYIVSNQVKNKKE